MDKDIYLSKFRLNLYELETLLSMAPLYDLTNEGLITRLNEVNLMLEHINKTYGYNAVPYLDEMGYVRAAFKNNDVAIYSSN